MSGRFGLMALDAPRKDRLPVGRAISMGEQLKRAEKNRAEFDRLLTQFGSSLTKADLDDVVSAYTGYRPYGASKAAVLKIAHNWQREMELNDDLYAAQAKLPV